MHYHGCIANIWRRRILWADSINLNEYAESNNLVIVYPQAKGDKKTGRGCYNWDVYTLDPGFDTKQGVQLRTVYNLLLDIDNAVAAAPPVDAFV